MTQQWRPMDKAPKDGTPILAWCRHESVPTHHEDGTPTPYGIYSEGDWRSSDGPHVIQWGTDETLLEELDHPDMHSPEWWFVRDTDFEIPAAPVGWLPIPDEPEVPR